MWKGSVKLEKPFIDVLVPLAEFELEVDVEADVEPPTPAREIKSVRKNVTLKQCRAVPSSQSPNIVKLFITGVLHKNIQFVEECSGFVRDHSVDVVFTTIKRVELENPVRNPFGHKDIEFSQKTSVAEFRELIKMDMEQTNVLLDRKHLRLLMSRLNVKFLVQKSGNLIFLKTMIIGEDSHNYRKSRNQNIPSLITKQKVVFESDHESSHHES